MGFAAGIVTGTVYFYLLWLTVKKLPVVKGKGMLLIGSLIIRLGLVLAVFYGVLKGTGEWENLIACFAGFMIVRFVSVRRVKKNV